MDIIQRSLIVILGAIVLASSAWSQQAAEPADRGAEPTEQTYDIGAAPDTMRRERPNAKSPGRDLSMERQDRLHDYRGSAGSKDSERKSKKRKSWSTHTPGVGETP